MGCGYRGFADRLAARLAREQPALLYANLGIRGRKIRQIREEQLEPALALEPDLVSIVGGLNDILRPRIDFDRSRRRSRAHGVGVRLPGRDGPRRDVPRRRQDHARGPAREAARQRLEPRDPRDRRPPRDADRRPRAPRRRRSPPLVAWTACTPTRRGTRGSPPRMAQALGLEPDEDPWAPLPPADPIRPRHRNQHRAGRG